VEVRELLPELLHGKLTTDVRESVESHVATCHECADELAVLRTARRVLAAAPAVDVASIVRALPAPPRARVVPAQRGRNIFRIAAAVSLISLGGVSLAVTRSFFVGRGSTATTDSVASLVTPAPDDDSVQLVLADPAARRTGSDGQLELTVGGGVSDLGIDDLRTLLGELEELEAAPDAEPEYNPGGRDLTGGVGAIKE
jgi:anti-sigma factor RsiW